MPDLKDRKQHEDDLASAIAVVLTWFRGAVQGKALDEMPWREFEERLFAAAVGPMSRTYTASVAGMSPGVSPTGLESRATEHAAALAREIVDRTHDGMAGAADAAAMFSLATILLSTNRAETIGVTETTRATSAGEAEAAAYSDTPLIPTWNTEADGRVCSVCGPLHGTEHERWETAFPGGPPAHPNCRCWLEWAA